MAKGKGGFIGQDGLNAPDPATAVTGTAGDGQVTVSWTNPTDVGGAAVNGYAISSTPSVPIVPPSLNTASYTSKSFSLSGQGTYNYYAMTFNGDGTKAYFTGFGPDAILQYSLSTAWDISTASYDNVSLDVSSQTTAGQSGLVFSPDGSKIYMASYTPDAVYQYNLSTPYDMSTGSYSNNSLTVNEDTNVQDVYLKPDGTKLFVLGDTNNSVFQYTISTPFDLSTASYDSVSFSTATQQTNCTGLFFSPDGTTMLICGYSPVQADKYTLSTPWVVSSASHISSFTLSEFGSNSPNAIFAGNDLNNLFVGGTSGSGNGIVYQYAVGMPTGSPFIYGGLTNGTSYTFNVWAINPFGWSSPSDASGGVSPQAPVMGFFMTDSSGGGSERIQYVNIATLGNASDYGDLEVEYNSRASGSSSTRGILAGGQNSGGSIQNNISYYTLATTGSGSDFGDLTESRGSATGISNSTRFVCCMGENTAFQRRYTMDYVTIASTGNATYFGDNSYRSYHACSTMSPTRGIMFGGRDGSLIANISYITIASTGGGTVFGDMGGGDGVGYGAALSNGSRAVVARGYTGNFAASNAMDYVTISSTGNSADYGDLGSSQYSLDATSSSTRGLFANVGYGVTIEYITIASTGNSVDFGDLVSSPSNGYLGAGNMGGDHGGLS